ncbi:MAG: CHRD domain-containing protein [Nitrososphaeraceae archaeon]|nr:CHRD domain-containing protein [Nitrososphaeraceae archaeon]
MTQTKLSTIQVLAIVLTLAVAALSAATLTNGAPTAFAQQQSQTFTAKLTGSNEVSPVNTPATGMAQFQLSSDGKELNYDLSATNLKGFMMAHVHQGKTGENGPPVTTPLSMGKGKITSSDLQGPLAGKQISDLVNIMKNGGAYVNVHTQQNQNGEIRGQIMSGA